MLVKTVDTTLTTDSAGQVVESIPVLPSDVPVQNAAGFWVDPIAMVEDDNGIPIRIVDESVVLNSVGKPVAATPGEGVGVPAGYALLRAYDGSIMRASDGSAMLVKVF